VIAPTATADQTTGVRRSFPVRWRRRCATRRRRRGQRSMTPLYLLWWARTLPVRLLRAWPAINPMWDRASPAPCSERGSLSSTAIMNSARPPCYVALAAGFRAKRMAMAKAGAQPCSGDWRRSWLLLSMSFF
jgi:hypothetical protein